MVVIRGESIGKEHTRTGDTGTEILVAIPDWRAEQSLRFSIGIRRRDVPGLERVNPGITAA